MKKISLIDPTDTDDNFIQLWGKLDDIIEDLGTLYIIEKSKLIVPKNNAN